MSTTASTGTLTSDMILANMRALRDQLDALPQVEHFDTVAIPPLWRAPLEAALAQVSGPVEPRMLLGSIRIVETPMAHIHARVHKRRKWMSEHYHIRIQKKWDKRFGYVPCAYLIDAKRLERLFMCSLYGDSQP